MRVLITPTVTSNPYISLLKTAVQAHNIEVDVSQSTAYTLFWMVAIKHRLPDLVHLQWQNRYFARRNEVTSLIAAVIFFTQWFLLRLCGVRFVWTVHDLVNHDRRSERVERWCSGLLFRCVDRVIVHCDEAARLVTDHYGVQRYAHKLLIVPIGPLGDWYREHTEVAQVDAMRQKLQIGREQTVILYLGVIRPNKRVPEMIDSFRTVATSDNRLIVAGNPKTAQLRVACQEAAGNDNRIILDLGFVPHQHLIDYVVASDIVVLPYQNILTSSVLTLAYSFRKPVIIPTIGCLKDFIDGGGIKYDPNQKDGLHLALKTAVQLSKKEMSEMGERGYQFGLDNGWDKTGRALAELFQQLTQ